MIDRMDERMGMGEWSDAEFEAHLDSLADKRADDEYWELRFKELQVSAVDEKAWAA